MSTEHIMHTSAPELEEVPWGLMDLPDSQVTIVEAGQIKEEKLISFYENFSAALDLTAPENIIEQP